MLNQQIMAEAEEKGESAELAEETQSTFTSDSNYIIYF
jgi:hypothetical protein